MEYIDTLVKTAKDLEKAARNYIIAVEEHRHGCGLPIMCSQRELLQVLNKMKEMFHG